MISYMKLLNTFSILFTLTAISNTNIGISQNESTNPILEKNYWESYSIEDKDFGTKTYVTLTKVYRKMTTNALPNHETGQFPNVGNPNKITAQNLTYEIPLNPKLSGKSNWVREPGVALNGVKFEPETAERFVCETGEVYRIEAFQELLDLGLDQNNAHVQPTGAYHYHGIPTGLINSLNPKDDIVHVGFAMDGFPIYYSQSGQYKPSFQLSEKLRTGDACSYKNPHQNLELDLNDSAPDGIFVSDWVFIEGLGDLDECNGTLLNGSYVYFVTDEYPYMSRCLKGIFKEESRPGPPPNHRHAPNQHMPPPRRN